MESSGPGFRIDVSIKRNIAISLVLAMCVSNRDVQTSKILGNQWKRAKRVNAAHSWTLQTVNLSLVLALFVSNRDVQTSKVLDKHVGSVKNGFGQIAGRSQLSTFHWL